MVDQTTRTLIARHGTHGDFNDNSNYAQAFKHVLRAAENDRNDRGQPRLTNAMREAMDLIVTKMARILAGNPAHVEHWDDIEGYARLISDRLRASNAPEVKLSEKPISSTTPMKLPLRGAQIKEESAVDAALAELDLTRDEKDKAS